MILEVALLTIKPGLEQMFEADFSRAEEYICSIEGYISHQLQRCIEFNNRYILLVKWQTLEAHTVGFRTSAQYQHWKDLLHHYYQPFPEVLHFQTI